MGMMCLLGFDPIAVRSSFQPPHSSRALCVLVHNAVFLQTWTGDIISLGDVDLLNQTFGANLRNDTRVFFSNGEHAQVVDYRSRSAKILNHPRRLKNGTLR